MKIIDDKGRLFGKLNLIDFLVIIFFVYFAFSFYSGYKLLQQKKTYLGDSVKKLSPAAATPEEKKIKIKVKFQEVMPELVKVIREGDVESDYFGHSIVKLSEITSNKPTQVLVMKLDKQKGKEEEEGGGLIAVPHPFYRDLWASMEVLAIKKDRTLYFKNSPIKIGTPFIFTTESYNLTGIIVNIEK